VFNTFPSIDNYQPELTTDLDLAELFIKLKSGKSIQRDHNTLLFSIQNLVIPVSKADEAMSFICDIIQI
jgi:hypothetical protein